MRIVMVPHAYTPAIGGAERYTQGLAEALLDLGHDAHVVVADIDNAEAYYELGHRPTGLAEESIGGVSVQRLPYRSVSYSVGSRLLGQGDRLTPFALRSSLGRFRSRLEDSLVALRPDAVMTLPHLFPNVVSTLAISGDRDWVVLYAPMLHEDDPYWKPSTIADAAAQADLVVALTEHERKRLIEGYRVPADGVLVVPPGVQPRSTDHEDLREDLVLFIGRQTASKRIDTLRAAMDTVWISNPNTSLVIAGAPSRDYAPPSDDERITVIDSPSDEEKNRLLARAAVVVNPSVQESFGMTTLEAWAHGAPVVLVESPTARSVVTHGVDGLITPPSATHLANAIREILDAPHLAAGLSRAGRATIAGRYEWPIVAATLVDAIEQRIAPRS